MYNLSAIACLMMSLLCSTVIQARPGIAEEFEIMKKIVMDCKVKEGASDLDVGEIMNFQIPSTMTGQCLNACLMEAAGMLIDGVITVEQAMAVTSHHIGSDAEKMKVADEVVSACVPALTSSDRCQYMMEFLQCSHAGAEAHGYAFKDVMSK